MLTTYDLIAPYIAQADDWRMFCDFYNPVYESEPRCSDVTYAVSEDLHGGYDGWLIVRFWINYRVYRVVGSFIFEVEF